jgi:hypothetical protein
MRSSIPVLVLVFLGACGGGDSDVTNPPAPQSFTLTVNSQGPGSGRVVSSAETSPAVDCTLAGSGQVIGACSGTYAEGTSVSITVTPDAGSTFTGWTGDAAACGAAPTCSLAMTQNRSAVAQLTSAAPPTTPVEIVSDTFYLEPGFGSNGAVIWVAEVRNTTSQVVESAELNFTSHDAAGNILASALSFVGPIPPGETRATQSFADYIGSDDLVQRIQDGWLEFDAAIAMADQMGKVGGLGRILGRRGLMPNPRSGTVVREVDDLPRVVNELKGGRIEFRNDRSGLLHVEVGRKSFDDQQLLENFNAIVDTVMREKPDGVKGIYCRSITLTSTMGPGVPVDVALAQQAAGHAAAA